MCQYTYTCYTSYFKKCCIFCFAATKINQSVLRNLVVDWVIHSSGRLLTKTPNTTDACLSVFEPQWSWSSLRVNVSNLWNCSPLFKFLFINLPGCHVISQSFITVLYPPEYILWLRYRYSRQIVDSDDIANKLLTVTI